MPLNRTLLDKEMDTVKENILTMSNRVDAALTGAMTALYQRDMQLAHKIIAEDEEINRLRYRAEQDSLLILATQAPAASDLRAVVAGIHIVVELERMGDHAAGIARLVERMEDEDEIASLHRLPKMEKQAHKMLNGTMEAFINHDADIAHALIKRDDKIDKHYRRLFGELLEELNNDTTYARRATFLMWVGHNLERFGDRATNIAERVIFMCTGEYVEIIEEID